MLIKHGHVFHTLCIYSFIHPHAIPEDCLNHLKNCFEFKSSRAVSILFKKEKEEKKGQNMKKKKKLCVGVIPRQDTAFQLLAITTNDLYSGSGPYMSE